MNAQAPTLASNFGSEPRVEPLPPTDGSVSRAAFPSGLEACSR